MKSWKVAGIVAFVATLAYFARYYQLNDTLDQIPVFNVLGSTFTLILILALSLRVLSEKQSLGDFESERGSLLLGLLAMGVFLIKDVASLYLPLF